MLLVALKILVGDRFKFFAMVFAVAASAFLVSQQVSIFTGLMDRTTSQIKDVGPMLDRRWQSDDAPVWVMHPGVRYIDELKALPDSDVQRVRSVDSVEWAVPLYKGFTRALSRTGDFRQAILMGFDDTTLIGAPSWMLLGSVADLRQPDAVILDDQGFRSLFPGQPLAIGGTLELSDRHAKIVGICRSSPPFATFPVIYTRYSTATTFVGKERNLMTFILAHPRQGTTPESLANTITRQTGLKALPARQFATDTIRFYVANTGIPVNFGITVSVAIIVGIIITGQTFLLFVLENTKPFAGLKAMGLTMPSLARMVLLQAASIGVLGLSLGIGMSWLFFFATREVPKLRNFLLHPEIAIGTAILMIAIALASSALALRKLGRLEPATVFRA